MRHFGYVMVGGAHGVLAAMGDIFFSDPAYWLTLAPMLAGVAIADGFS